MFAKLRLVCLLIYTSFIKKIRVQYQSDKYNICDIDVFDGVFPTIKLQPGFFMSIRRHIRPYVEEYKS